MADPRLRNIKIKTGVLKRFGKDKYMYEKEASLQETKIETMKQNGADEYDVKKQTEVLDESLRMIPDIIRKIDSSKQELQSLLDNNKDLVDTEEYKTAKEILETVSNVK